MEEKEHYSPAEVAEMIGTYWATRTACDSITAILGKSSMSKPGLEGPRRDLETARQSTFEHAREVIPENVRREFKEPYL